MLGTVMNHNQLVCVTPTTLKAGMQSLQVLFDSHAVLATKDFTVLPELKPSGLTPGSGPVGGGTTVSFTMASTLTTIDKRVKCRFGGNALVVATRGKGDSWSCNTPAAAKRLRMT